MATVAIKLYEMLEPLKGYETDNKARKHLWHQLANEKFAGNTVRMYEALSSARREVINQLDAVANNPKSTEFLISQVDKVFGQLDLTKIHSHWSADMEAIDSLVSIDELLTASGYGEPDVDIDLEDVLFRLNELKREVKRSEIDPNVKKFLVEALSSLTFSIDQFYVYGEVGLRKAYAAAVGNIVAARKVHEDYTTVERDLFGKIKEVLEIIDVALAVGDQGIALAQAIGPLLIG